MEYWLVRTIYPLKYRSTPSLSSKELAGLSHCHGQHTYRLECLNLGAECASFHVFLGQVVPGVTGIPTLTRILFVADVPRSTSLAPPHGLALALVTLRLRDDMYQKGSGMFTTRELIEWI